MKFPMLYLTGSGLLGIIFVVVTVQILVYTSQEQFEEAKGILLG